MSKPATAIAFPIVAAFFVSSIATIAAGNPPTVYEALESYDFPIGLLPKGVVGYELDGDTGKFKVNLNKSCSFSIQGYDLKYKATISGTISKDRIKGLKGIQVKVLLFWVKIVEVTRDGDDIDFSVGIASATFGVDNFGECPQCGCGFDCVNSSREEESTRLKGLFGHFLVDGA